MFNKITPTVYYWMNCLDSTYLELTNQNALKVPNVINPTNNISGFINLWIPVYFKVQYPILP